MRTLPSILILLLASLVLSCSNPSAMEVKIRQDMEKNFAAGTYDARVFGNVAYSNPRIVELQRKMTESIKQNAEWFTAFKEKYDYPLPYHVNLGLTKDEYKEFLLMTGQSKPELQLTAVEKVEVIVKKNEISFKSQGELKFFNELKIDLKKNTVEMKGHKLAFLKQESVTDTLNAFKSPYSGYTWQFLEPGNAVKIQPADYKKQNVSIYTVTIGRIESINRPFMIIKGLEFDEGKKVFDFEAPVIF